MSKVLKLIFGDPTKKVMADLRKEADDINALEPEISKLTDAELKAKTQEFKDRLEKGETLDDIAHIAFAVVRETAKRTLGQRHYDVQLMGGLVLHRGQIAEMRTGEGKTLTSTLPIYLNALSGKGVHVVTVNDYLAKRDAVWMGQIFAFHGLTVGCIQHESGYRYDEEFKADNQDDEERDTTGSFKVQMDFLRPVERNEAYTADVTYGTNNEFGFDYLRDNMATDKNMLVQRELNYTIIDEIDSILIDEARTPLIISAPAEESGDLYRKFAVFVRDLKENEDYNIDEKMRVATFTDEGVTKIEKLLGVDNLYTSGGLEFIHHAEQALKAHAIFQIDRDYVIQDGEVKIVDEFTGRIMEGRRYSEGLHQAIEAKEGVEIKRESRTMATITFQNLFRMYNKLSGMTGTAVTEAEEFGQIYGLEVVEVPTNMPIARFDKPDRIYKNERGKWLSIVQDVKALQEKGQPVLVGTVSIEKNEQLSEFLTKAGIKHSVLNAKNHEGEAQIIAQAGEKGSVTVATNMAGRGVDIVLGGNPSTEQEQRDVKDFGGLHVLGTERHESRRIDNQLRGRAGRQGDPGTTQFYVSLEDDLMRIFGSDRVKAMMETFKIDETTPIESKMISKSLEKAQSRVEGRHFDARKHVLEYDDVLNKHRTTIYERRRAILVDDDFDARAHILEMIENEVERVVFFHTGDLLATDVPDAFKENKDAKRQSENETDWDPGEIVEVIRTILPVDADLEGKIRKEFAEVSKDKELLAGQRTAVIEATMDAVNAKFAEVEKAVTEKELLAKMERTVLLRAIDNLWVQHLDEMKFLRRSVGLRGYGQRDPLVEYKRESYDLYNTLNQNIEREVVYNIVKIYEQALSTQKVIQLAPSIIQRARLQFAGAQKTMGKQTAVAIGDGSPSPSGSGAGAGSAEDTQTVRSDVTKAGRNDACPCGATKEDGTPKKYKHCHGKS
ncbi:MAG: preprotein translocase subunit SecA [Candidatus Uhrbacteria bacterium]|nr:preprotein translocase subunit SecA [Candidatus Uhrbacteria bacterium]